MNFAVSIGQPHRIFWRFLNSKLSRGNDWSSRNLGQRFSVVLAPPSYLQSHSLFSDVNDLLVEVDADGVHVRRRERLGHEPLG